MSAAEQPRPRGDPWWPWRHIAFAGSAFVLAICAFSVFDVVRSYHEAVAETGRNLQTQARVIAEQAARSLQAVDGVLRHVADDQRKGALRRMSPAELHTYLKNQAVGLEQAEALVVFDEEGRLLASSAIEADVLPAISLADDPAFRVVREHRQPTALVGTARVGRQMTSGWFMPVARRLEGPDGRFAGAVAASVRVAYFENFYRDVRPEAGTSIALVHDDGTLVARHPADAAALGRRIPELDHLGPAWQADANAASNVVARAPVDGREVFGVRTQVAGRSLAVVLTRDTAAALGAWRERSIGIAMLTCALVLLAIALLTMLRRQLLRVSRMRASLEQSRERFALAAAGSEEGIWDWDIANDAVYASPRAREIFGIGPGAEVQPRAKWQAEIQLHPDDAARRTTAMADHLAGRTPVYAGEYRVRHIGPPAQAGGDPWRWVRVRGLCVRNAKGDALRVAGSVTDIDAQRRAEDALRLSEERYALAMAGLTGGHWVWEVATDALFVSGSVHRLLGLSEETVMSTRAEYFSRVKVHPDDWPELARINEDIISGRVSRMDVEYRIVLPGQEEPRWILMRAQSFPGPDGKPLRVAGVSVDVTPRKRTEQALRQSEERFALAVAGSNDGILDWDLVNDRMYSSERAMRMLGVVSDTTTRTRAEWMALIDVHPDDRERHAEDLRQHLDGGSDVRDGEYRIRATGGTWRWVRVRMLCVRDEQGRATRLAGSVSDIDPYKRVEAALRESEERYAFAMTGSNEGHWVWDFDSQEIYVSARLSEMFDLGEGARVMPGQQYFDRIPLHPEDHERVHRARNDHVAGLTPRLDHEFRVLLPGSGEVRWVHTRAQCFRDTDGRPLRLAGSTVDITPRKRAEEALRLSEERYTLAVAGSDDGVWDWDLVAGVAFESARARQLQGLPPGPEVQTVDELVRSLRVHPDDAARRAEGIRAHLAGETPAYECDYRVQHDDGEYRWVHVRALCIRDAHGTPYRMAGSVSDIDAQNKAEEALRRSEERFQLAVTGSDQGLWDWDMETDSLFLSPRAQQLLWVEPGQPQRPRRDWIELTAYHPDDLGPVREALAEYLRGGSRSFKVEYRVRHHSGSWHWYRQRGIAVRDARGRPTRMAGSMEDITDRKNADVERDRLEAQLRQAQKLEAIGTLAGGIAHDFNNILAAILGYGEMAMKDAAEGSSQRRHIEAAVSAGMRAKSLVERILAFSRSGIGERVPVHVQSVVHEALDQLGASVSSGITIERRLVCGDAAVLGDPTQVHQVVMNLCANAVQAMRSQGTLQVTLEQVREDEPQSMTGPLPAGNYVRLRVCDNGSGISPQVLERIFDPFFTTKAVGVGTGLGLSLVHGIVTDLGGGIHVLSEVGVGSTFTVLLPWGSQVAPPARDEEAVPAGNGETVLLVDDEEALVRLGEEMIAELGYEPVGFTSSRAALEAFKASPMRFDAVLSDVSMPEMTGSELAQAVRALRADIPIVLMSGYVTPALTQRARETGVAEVLSKPLVARDIARSLAGALRQNTGTLATSSP
jgi:PAS domain S-box-containing protein